MVKYILLLLVAILLNSCGAGTHGKIKEYSLKRSNNEIVSIVDQYLIKNPDYFGGIDDSGYGWVHVKIPSTGEHFSFRIGGDSQIVLIGAGKNNQPEKWNADLGFFEKQTLIKSFEQNFFNKLRAIKPRKLLIVNYPFVLTLNTDLDGHPWPDRSIKVDTMISVTLPEDFKKLPRRYFQDLVLSYAQDANKKIDIVQLGDLFIIDSRYSGYISDSIYVTNFYRRIGQEANYYSIFNDESWSEYFTKKNAKTRASQYEAAKLWREKNGYSSSQVWMKSFYNPKKQVVKLDTLH